MATSGVFVLSLCSIYYLCLVSVDPVGGCSIMTRQDYTFNEAWGGFYKLHGLPATWEQARLTCEMEGAVLATPYTFKATKALGDIVNERHISCGIFIGAKETLSKGDYRTIEGISLCRIPHEWANNEPNSMVDSCLVLLPDGTLADEPCSTILPFVCYKKQEECNSCRNQCKTSDRAYKFNQRTGSCYKFHDTPQPWGSAVKTCDDEGGHMVIINSQVEADILKAMFAEYPPSAIIGATHTTVIHVGFHNLIQGWRNIDGKNLTASGFNTWSPGQPDNAGNNEHCGSIFRTGLLNDVACPASCAFICEIEPAPVYV